MRIAICATLTFMLAMNAPALDMSAIEEEPNLEKRSEQALEFANSALDEARDAYKEGRWEETQSAMADIGAAVELSYQSLQDTGKDPRKHSKYFKRAEKETRKLLRRLKSMRSSMSAVDFPVIDPVIETVKEINDDLVLGIMTGN